MTQVIGAQGNVVRDEPTPTAFASASDDKHNLVFRAVVRELGNPRAGTASTKKRDEVRGGGKKPWRQKGTGRARQGSTRSPQWRHGGVVFGPQPRSFVSSLNKKERRAAFVAALSDRFATGAVSLLDGAALEVTKTKDLARVLFGSAKAAKKGPSTLVVFAESELASAGGKLLRAGANLPNVAVTHNGALDVKDVLGYARLVLTAEAQNALATRFAETQ